MKTQYRYTSSLRGLWTGQVAIFLLFILFMSGPVASAELVVDNPYRVKAAFLRNFAHYVTWPDEAFSGSDSSWCIGVLGRDPFGEILEKTFQGRSEQGRVFEIFRADTPDELPPCQIIFIAYRGAAQRLAVLDKLKNRPVLTVSDAPEFLLEGGVIRFQVGDRVSMSINLDQARAAALKIQTRMLEVSSDILEHGKLHHVR